MIWLFTRVVSFADNDGLTEEAKNVISKRKLALTDISLDKHQIKIRKWKCILSVTLFSNKMGLSQNQLRLGSLVSLITLFRQGKLS